MFSKLIRLGKDAELATTKTGKQVLRIIGAYDIGYGDSKRTQWIECALWGDRGAKVAQYMTKGTQIVVYLDDLESDAYEGKNGIGSKLKGRVVSFEFAGSKDSEQVAQQTTQAYHQQGQQQAPKQSASFDDDFNDDIPF